MSNIVEASQPRPVEPDRPARRPQRMAAFVVLAVGGLACDLSTKTWAFDTLGPPGPGVRRMWIVPGALSLLPNLNRGALFGIGQGGVALFAIASAVAVAAILYFVVFRGATRSWLYATVLGLVMAGALGNLYDRLGLHGLRETAHGIIFLPGEVPPGSQTEPVKAVRDFIYFKWWFIDWPIFNFADSFLMTGVCMLIAHSLLTKPAEEREQVDEATALPR